MIVDIVPNHMAMPVPEPLNRPLWSVLRDGPGSPYARWFDIDWAAQDGRLLLPVLGGPVGDCLGRPEAGQPAADVSRCSATSSTCCPCGRAPRACR